MTIRHIHTKPQTVFCNSELCKSRGKLSYVCITCQSRCIAVPSQSSKQRVTNSPMIHRVLTLLFALPLRS